MIKEANSLAPEMLWHIDAWIIVLRKRYDANPQHFRSERICFLDHLFAQQWIFNFKDFKDSKPDQNGLGRRLPGGAWNYYAGTIPSFCQSNKVWGTDINDIYAPVNFTDSHWIAMWISIPKRHIVVFDSICFSISPEELDVVMELFLYMVPYLLVECASSDKVRAQYSPEPFTKDFAKPNGKSMMDKMAVDLFQEIPNVHEFENKDMDDIL
uniref:Ubiquitin-like protease family profile domain-containing protein n=1 Tax=Brassica oleracea var. oleracea TaxID=109376 RepID=A0A0D3BWC9_BRAOL